MHRNAANKLDNKSQADDLFRVIFEPDDLVELRCLNIHDKKDVVQRYIKAANIGTSRAWWTKQNARGLDVYFGANPRKRRGGTARDVACFRCFVADLDDTGEVPEAERRVEEANLPQPTAIVKTGRGLHLYWRIDSDPNVSICDANLWRQIQDGLNAVIGADRAINDPPRVFRLPGTLNQKRNGLACELVRIDPDNVWEIREFEHLAITAKPIVESNKQILCKFDDNREGREIAKRFVAQYAIDAKNGQRNHTAYKLAGQLRDNGVSYDDAADAMRTFHKLCDPSPVGEPEFTIDEAMGILERRYTQEEPREPAKHPDPSKRRLKKQPDEQELLSPILRPMSTYERIETTWLMWNRIPMGCPTLLVGAYGVGKGMMSVDLATRVSCGQKMPFESKAADPGGVLLVNVEDDPNRRLRPHLDVAGADLDRVFLMPGIRSGDSPKTFNLKAHLPQFRDAMANVPDLRLVIVDPIGMYLAGSDSNAYADIYAAIGPLGTLAQETGVAMVLVHHVNKRKADNAAERTMGSTAFGAAVRSALYLVRDPDDQNARLLLHGKSNLCPEQPGLRFVIEETGLIRWTHDNIEGNADQFFAQDAKISNGISDTQLERCCEWLDAKLDKGPLISNELADEAKATGFSTRTLDRAKAKIGVKATPIRGLDGKVMHWEITRK